MKPTAALPFMVLASLMSLTTVPSTADETTTLWKKHIIHQGAHTVTAIAADFTGDGKSDVISNSAGKTRLFVGPDWKEIILDDNRQHGFIHSECFDVDGDGDMDYIGARYDPGLIVWLECPENPLTDKWPQRLVDDQVHGIHGLLKGDVDQDGRYDLLATQRPAQGAVSQFLGLVSRAQGSQNRESLGPAHLCQERCPWFVALPGLWRCQRRWPARCRDRSQRRPASGTRNRKLLRLVGSRRPIPPRFGKSTRLPAINLEPPTFTRRMSTATARWTSSPRADTATAWCGLKPPIGRRTTSTPPSRNRIALRFRIWTAMATSMPPHAVMATKSRRGLKTMAKANSKPTSSARTRKPTTSARRFG